MSRGFNPLLLSSTPLQGEFGAPEGEIERCGEMQTREGVGGVLRAGQPAARTPQRQLRPGQGLHHEADHQLPAHAEPPLHRSVSEGKRLNVFVCASLHSVKYNMMLLDPNAQEQNLCF